MLDYRREHNAGVYHWSGQPSCSPVAGLHQTAIGAARTTLLISAHSREAGVATEMLLTKAEQVSDDGRAPLSERVRGLIIEPELAELSADLGRHLGEAGTFRDLSAIQAWVRVAT